MIRVRKGRGLPTPPGWTEQKEYLTMPMPWEERIYTPSTAKGMDELEKDQLSYQLKYNGQHHEHPVAPNGGDSAKLFPQKEGRYPTLTEELFQGKGMADEIRHVSRQLRRKITGEDFPDSSMEPVAVSDSMISDARRMNEALHEARELLVHLYENQL